jgi:hypothetical protein
MSTVVCPRCSCRQAAGAECRICHAPLPKEEVRYSAAPPADVVRAPEPPQTPGKTPPGLLRKIWRISNWMTLAALIVVIVLLLRPAPAPVIPADPQAASRAAAKVRESQGAASEGRPTPLRLDEAELNAFLAANLGLEGRSNAAPAGGTNSAATDAGGSPGAAAAQGDSAGGLPGAVAGQNGTGGSEPSIDEVRSNVKDVKVTMQDDRVQAYVLFDFHGKDLTLVLEGRLAAKDGYLRFIPTSGKIGSLPIPQSTLEGAVQRMLDSPENRDKLRLPDGVGDVRIENGQLVVAPKE